MEVWWLSGTHVDDAAQSPDSVRSVEDIAADCGILHDDTGGHNNIFGRVCKFLQDQIYHLLGSGQNSPHVPADVVGDDMIHLGRNF